MNYNVNEFPDKVKKIFKEWDYQPSNYKEANTVLKAYYEVERNKPLKLKAESFDEKNPKFIVIDKGCFPVVSGKVWRQMDDSQKLNLTYKIFDYFCDKYDVKDFKFLLFPSDNGCFNNCFGYCDDEEKELFINPLCILGENSNIYSVCDIIIHEITHAKHYKFRDRNKAIIEKDNNIFYQDILYGGSLVKEYINYNTHIINKKLAEKIRRFSKEDAWNGFLMLMGCNSKFEQAAVNKSIKWLDKLYRQNKDNIVEDDKSFNDFMDVFEDNKYYNNYYMHFNDDYGFRLKPKDIDVIQKISIVYARELGQCGGLYKEYDKVKDDNPQMAEKIGKEIYKKYAKIEKCYELLAKIYENKKMTKSKLVDEIKKEYAFENDVKSV